MIQQNASASEEMASTSEELSSQAEQLQDTISFFKVETVAGKAARKSQPRISHAALSSQQEKVNPQTATSKGLVLDMAQDNARLDSEFDSY